MCPLPHAHRGLLSSRTDVSAPATLLLADYACLTVFLAGSVLIERLTIRPISHVTHPLTGKSRRTLELDCQKAISLAPAGNPTLERGTWQPVLAGLLAGPGLAASLWWSGGEEEMGWMARRAWREADAVYGSKKR